jgi:hypothetical protein
VLVIELNKSHFVAQLERLDKLVLGEGEQLGRLNVHLLPLQNINQLHLLLECLQEFVALPLQPFVLVSEAVEVSPDLVVLAHFLQLGLPQLQLELLDLFKRPVQLGLLVGLVLGRPLDLHLRRAHVLLAVF